MLPSIVSLDPRDDAKNDNERGEDDGNQVFATRSSCHLEEERIFGSAIAGWIAIARTGTRKV